MGVVGEGGGGAGRVVRTDWTDHGSVRGVSAGGAVEDGSRVVLGLESGSRVPLASVRGSGVDMAGLRNWEVL